MNHEMREVTLKAKLIAFYLPQFHPIPENDEWWGKGFTEWTNVAKARKLFPGHYQPRIPADLGYCDLRLPEVREAQAELAREYGLTGFCYWHYWFGGRQILERPFAEVLASGRPDFPFCLGWANESWSGVWHGAPDRILLRQTYPGPEDHENHFQSVLPAFLDDRYLKVDGCPLFVLYRPSQIPDLERFVVDWRQRAVRAGLKGMHFIGIDSQGGIERAPCLDAVIPYLPQFGKLRLNGVSPELRDLVRSLIGRFKGGVLQREQGGEFPMVPFNIWPQLYSYREFVRDAFTDIKFDDHVIPLVVPNWDNTPRCGIKGGVFPNATPALFSEHVRQAIRIVADRDTERTLVFVRSWNEWAEGNHLEPDLKFGLGFLKAIRAEVLGDATP